MLPKLKFDVGDIVRHKVFGVGEIIKIDNITQTYEIQFREYKRNKKNNVSCRGLKKSVSRINSYN